MLALSLSTQKNLPVRWLRSDRRERFFALLRMTVGRQALLAEIALCGGRAGRGPCRRWVRRGAGEARRPRRSSSFVSAVIRARRPRPGADPTLADDASNPAGTRPLGAARVDGALLPANQSALFHAAQMKREPAALPANRRGQIGRAQPPVLGLGEREQHFTAAGRERRLLLQLLAELRSQLFRGLDVPAWRTRSCSSVRRLLKFARTVH